MQVLYRCDRSKLFMKLFLFQLREISKGDSLRNVLLNVLTKGSEVYVRNLGVIMPLYIIERGFIQRGVSLSNGLEFI